MKAVNIFILMIISSVVTAQNHKLTTGAYLAQDGNTKHLWLFVDNYCSYIEFTDHQFVRTWGGPFSHDSNKIVTKIEYDTYDEGQVGTEHVTSASVSQNKIEGKHLIWEKVNNEKQNLDGLWRITGRQQSAVISSIPKGDRKTIKILVDGFFQWIAINPAVKGFYGTGGGKYTYKDLKYIENILFFSRDNSRVGHTLEFKGEIINGEWHHSGLSSKGDPIFEIWSREN